MKPVPRAVGLIAVVVGCISGGMVSLLPRERALIDWWLVCIECEAARDSIKALGARNPEATIDALDLALVKGPPPAIVVSAESALAVSFVRDSSFRARTGLGLIPLRSRYVKEGSDRYRNGYQVRGAIGLAVIGTNAAKARLDSASHLMLPTPVKAAVIYARDSFP